MKIRLITIIILSLCALSIIIGLLNTAKTEKAAQKCPMPSQESIFKGFSTGGNKIALITLDGVIISDGTGSFLRDFTSAESALTALQKANEDKTVKGVLFRINSPGGTVAMSQEIFNSILELRKNKPVVVSMADVAASGGYYIASAADRIIANPGTLTGSIGVIMETLNARELLTNKLGIESEIIKSGEFKDTGNIYRPLSPEEKILLENLIDNAYKQFVNAIVQGRIERKDGYKTEKTDLTRENLNKYADGRIFTGEQAFEYGFVDRLGSRIIAEESIRKMAKEKFSFISDDIPIVDYNKPSGLRQLFFNLSARLVLGHKNLETLMPFSMRYARQPLFIWE